MRMQRHEVVYRRVLKRILSLDQELSKHTKIKDMIDTERYDPYCF